MQLDEATPRASARSELHAFMRRKKRKRQHGNRKSVMRVVTRTKMKVMTRRMTMERTTKTTKKTMREVQMVEVDELEFSSHQVENDPTLGWKRRLILNLFGVHRGRVHHTTQPGSSPLAHAGTITFAQQITPPPGLFNIPFPTKKAWLNSVEYRALKQKSENANHASTVIVRDNKNLQMQYVEGLDGVSVDGAGAATRRSLARALFFQSELARIAPPKWGQATTHIKCSFYTQFENLVSDISYTKYH
ncbi:hypothetical protein PM082_018422 [Marasmius tenuissimus]|nr:hypothetical protein PM082_018422 [Marasmius tenuissimus]